MQFIASLTTLALPGDAAFVRGLSSGHIHYEFEPMLIYSPVYPPSFLTLAQLSPVIIESSHTYYFMITPLSILPFLPSFDDFIVLTRLVLRAPLCAPTFLQYGALGVHCRGEKLGITRL